MSRRLWILSAALVLLVACDQVKVQPMPKLPTVVTKEVDKFVPLDPALLADCPIAEPANLQVGEAVRVANARKLSLQKCNQDKAAIRAAQPATASSATH